MNPILAQGWESGNRPGPATAQEAGVNATRAAMA